MSTMVTGPAAEKLVHVPRGTARIVAETLGAVSNAPLGELGSLTPGTATLRG